MSASKVCTGCNIEKDLSMFYNDKNRRDGKGSRCRTCYSERYKERTRLGIKPKPRISISERFWSKACRSEGDACWEWTALRNSRGYGRFQVKQGRNTPAHRFSWELTHGTIPEGLCVLHRCDNPPCVNPNHLFLGTKMDNMADKVAKGRQARGAACISRTTFEAKIDETAVREIRLLNSQGHKPKTIAARYGLRVRHVRDIVKHRAWKHIA